MRSQSKRARRSSEMILHSDRLQNRVDDVPSLREFMAQITRENRYDEIPTGRVYVMEAVQW